jgi:hypothetical protein
MTKQFLIEFECGEGTRWICNDEKLTESLRQRCDLFAAFSTLGPIPGVTVIPLNEAVSIGEDAICPSPRKPRAKR